MALFTLVAYDISGPCYTLSSFGEDPGFRVKTPHHLVLDENNITKIKKADMVQSFLTFIYFNESLTYNRGACVVARQKASNAV